jgi:hypothetical protein
MDPDLSAFLQHFDYREPLLQRWALDLIDALAGGPDPEAAEKVTERLATPELVTAIFKTQDSDLILRALSALPAKHLRPVQKDIEALWQSSIDEDRFPWGLARKLCDLDPQAAARLFEETLAAVRSDTPGGERFKLPQIATTLPRLAHPAAPQLANTLIELYGHLTETASEVPMLPDYVLALAWHFDHPEVIDFLEAYLADPRQWESQPPRWHLAHLAYMLADADAECHLACDRIEKKARFDLVDLAPFYLPDTDLAALDEQMRQVGLRRYGAALDLLARTLPLVSDPRQARLIQSLVDARTLATKLHKKKQRPYLYGLILSLLLRALRRSELETEKLGADRLLELLAADPISLPHKDAVLAWLADRPTPDLQQRLQRQLVATQGRLPAKALIELAGQLKDADLVAALLNLPQAAFDSEAYHAGVERALIASGEGCFDVADRIWDEMGSEQKILMLQVAEGVCGVRARQWVEAHFDEFWHLDRERLLEICPLLGNDCRRRLEPLVDKKQPLVDETWLTLSLLSGDRCEAVLALLGAYYAAEAERKAHIEALLEEPEDPLEAMPSSIDAELSCGHCGQAFSYPLSRIWINVEAAADTYPGEELQCLGCHHLADFAYTKDGSWQVGMYLMDLNMADSAAQFEALLAKSPFDILPREINFRGEKQIGAAVAACRQAMAQDPKDPLLWFELGNIYVNIDHRVKAQQSFENAIDLAPDAIEAYLMLAQMAIDKKDYADARHQLERGQIHLEKPRLLMSADASSDQMVFFYRLLQERLAQPEPDLSDIFADTEPPMLREEKIGRNDPCPCGSGKKYKKCCLPTRK